MSSEKQKRRGRVVRVVLALLFASAACLMGAIATVNAFPSVPLTLLGLEHKGSLADALPLDPALLTLSGEPLKHVDLIVPPQVAEPITLSSSNVSQHAPWSHPLLGDASSPGITSYLLTLDEDTLNNLLAAQIISGGPDNDRYRRLAVDLQPGGLVLSADVDLGIRWQRMGLLLLHDEDSVSLSPAGILLEDELYAIPESGALARMLLPTGRRAQRALYALTIVGPLPGDARVELARFHGDRLQILARATYAAHTLPDTGWRQLEPGVELRQMDVSVAPEGTKERLSIVRVNPAHVRLRVHYSPMDAKPISAWAAPLEETLLVINGSYFAPESEQGRQTVGLVISDGQRWGRPLDNYAGMLAVGADEQVSVRWLRDRPYNPEEPLTQAVQSFPVLVKPGGLMGFPADADDGITARRTVVAQDTQGNILLLVAPRGTLSLHELARFLVESDLTIGVALNLDGGASTGMWLSGTEMRVQIDSFAPVPTVIAVERR